MAGKLGMPQPHIARLELGEHNPSLDMLQRLAQGLGLCFIIGVVPSERADDLKLPKGVRVMADIRSADGCRVLTGTG